MSTKSSARTVIEGRRAHLVDDWVSSSLGNRRIGERQGRYDWCEPTRFGGFRQSHELTSTEHARVQLVPAPIGQSQDPLRKPVVRSNTGEVSWSVVR